MTTWRDNLGRVTMADGRRLIGASFRGVPFYVESSERSGGRRVVVHEFPRRDDPYVDDLGRRARAFNVEGYVLGDDYLAQRDALVAALEDESEPGLLVHPYHGRRVASCSQFTVHEQVGEGGIARFAIEFQEAPAQQAAPSIAPDLPGQVDASADAARSAAAGDFDANFDSAGMPTWALASAALALARMTAAVGTALAPVVEATQELAMLNLQVELLTAEASSLVRTPGEVADRFGAVLGALEDTVVGAPLAVVGALVSAYSADLGLEPSATTATREREQANWIAIRSLLRQVVTVEAARLAAVGEYDTVDQATATRDSITDQIDELLETAGDEAYQALAQLRSDLVNAVPPPDLAARIQTVTRPAAIPSLLLTYQLYGSVDQEADVLARNPQVKHPGFVSGDLEVLVDG